MIRRRLVDSTVQYDIIRQKSNVLVISRIDERNNANENHNVTSLIIIENNINSAKTRSMKY